jgi:hypothetical protein
MNTATAASKAQGTTSSNGIRRLVPGKLVRRATLDLAFTPGRTNNGKVIETHFFEHPSAYGFGWFVSLENDAVVLEHGGDWSGYRTHIIRVPSRQVPRYLASSAPPTLPSSCLDTIRPSP